MPGRSKEALWYFAVFGKLAAIANAHASHPTIIQADAEISPNVVLEYEKHHDQHGYSDLGRLIAVHFDYDHYRYPDRKLRVTYSRRQLLLALNELTETVPTPIHTETILPHVDMTHLRKLLETEDDPITPEAKPQEDDYDDIN